MKAHEDSSNVSSVLVEMVRALRNELESKGQDLAAKTIPFLESGIKKWTEALPQITFKPLIEWTNSIIGESQNLAKELAASPDKARAEIEAFDEKMGEQIYNLYLMYFNTEG